MLMNVYAIKDLLADEFGPLFEAKNNEVASRNFRQLFKDNSNAKASEYELYLLGTYDREEGVVFFGHYEERDGKCYFVREYIPVEVEIDG